LIAVAVPIAGLIVRAQSGSNLRAAWRDAQPELAHSLALAAAGAAATLGLALPLAHGWVAAHRQPRALINTDAALVLGYALRFVAVAVIVMFAGWARQSGTAELAARVHNVRATDRFVRLMLPTRAPAAAAAFFLVALLVAAELEISLILVRPGPTTLGVRLYTLIHTAPDADVAALALDVLLVVILAALAFAVLSLLVRRLAQRRSA
jgi:iron(III) transport system permease protein